MVNSYRGNRDHDIRIQFTEKYTEKIEYEDKLPEGMTEEDIQKEFGKVVYCEYTDCFWNKRVKDLQKTWGTINGNPNFEPLYPNEMVWNTVCTRPNEIVVRFKSFRDTSGGRTQVPYCYNTASNGKTGHKDFGSLLQGDGTHYGGSLDSQHASIDYDPGAYL